MRSGSWIQATGPNNGHQLRDYSKSSNRSENRPLIYASFYKTTSLVSSGMPKDPNDPIKVEDAMKFYQ